MYVCMYVYIYIYTQIRRLTVLQAVRRHAPKPSEIHNVSTEIDRKGVFNVAF